MTKTHKELRKLTAQELRPFIRSGEYRSHTAGLAPSFLQANLVILPEAYALDFMRYCQRNPKPCPLVGVSDSGDPMMWTLGEDIDIRTDVPQYYVYKNGVKTEERSDIIDLWQDDFVAFGLGCSFTFENALQEAGIPLWHIDNDTTVPMFRTNIKTTGAGKFSGGSVVSMRMIDRARVAEASEISSRFPLAHGAPLHIGDPAEIGIKDLTSPDFGDPAEITIDQVPVFWACGVTPQVALENAKIPICITHKPGAMLITDIKEDAQVPIYNKLK